jgi:glycosyltransferase involved in cell wall biosynthesis
VRVSVVVTVRNEEHSVDELIHSLLAQTRAPDEIILTDGGSTDRTAEVVEGWVRWGAPIVFRSCPGANIAAGRNRAVEMAGGEVIACTDAGVRLDPRWLERITAPFDDGADVVMGFFRSAPRNTFERALGATTLPDADEIVPERFVASSRSIAYRRSAWEKVGGYPEWLDYGEDVVFDLALRAAGLRFVWEPRAVVHFRPRPSLPAFVRQYYRYARGDGKANLWPRRHLIRYLTYMAAPLALVIGFWYKGTWVAVSLLASLYVYRPYRRLARSWDQMSRWERPFVLALVPLLRFVGDVAKMLGYPVGVWWRVRRERVDA